MQNFLSSPKPAICTFLSLLFVYFITGCTGGGIFIGSTEVRDLSLDDDEIEIGSTTELTVEFVVESNDVDDSDWPGDVDYETEAFDLVILLPQGVEFVDGSSYLTDSLFGDVVFGNEDFRGPNRVELCDDGSSILVYEFAENELSNATFLDNVLKYIELSLQGVSETEDARIEARADSHISSPCSISGEESEHISVYR